MLCAVPWPGRSALRESELGSGCAVPGLRESRGLEHVDSKLKDLENLCPWGKLLLGSMNFWLGSHLARAMRWTIQGYCWRSVFICSGSFSRTSAHRGTAMAGARKNTNTEILHQMKKHCTGLIKQTTFVCIVFHKHRHPHRGNDNTYLKG